MLKRPKAARAIMQFNENLLTRCIGDYIVKKYEQKPLERGGCCSEGFVLTAREIGIVSHISRFISEQPLMNVRF